MAGYGGGSGNPMDFINQWWSNRNLASGFQGNQLQQWQDLLSGKISPMDLPQFKGTLEAQNIGIRQSQAEMDRTLTAKGIGGGAYAQAMQAPEDQGIKNALNLWNQMYSKAGTEGTNLANTMMAQILRSPSSPTPAGGGGGANYMNMAGSTLGGIGGLLAGLTSTGIFAPAAAAGGAGGLGAGATGGAGLGMGAGTAAGGTAAGGTAAGSSGLLAALAALCCFIFLEANEGYLEEDVRRYRDDFYPKGGLVDKGYRSMASWLVPLMHNHKSIKKLIRIVMIKPLSWYARWYYGHNSYGLIFYPLAKLWPAIWSGIGKLIQLGEVKCQIKTM